MRRVNLLVALAFLAHAPYAFAETAKAAIRGTGLQPDLQGEVTLTDTDSGLLIQGSLTGASAGLHGFHIHEFGLCDDNGNAAGSHFNPKGTPHGNVIADGQEKAHVGDLGNLTVREDGTATWLYTLPGLTLAKGSNAVAGRALIVHEKPDDFGQPTGNAGGRIGCGSILLSGR